MNRLSFSLFFFAVLVLSCNNTPTPTTEVPADIQTMAEPSNNLPKTTAPGKTEGRAAWQKPALVVDQLGDLEGKVIADIGTGTGYFAFRLINKAKKVIAVDIDPDMLNLIELFRDNLDSLQQSKISTRLAATDSPNLEKDEVDIALIINTIGFIEDRTAYLENLRSVIMSGGEVVIVDFKMKRIPDNIAPPIEYRVSLLELENILVASGYDNISTDDRSLDYQYIVKATRD